MTHESVLILMIGLPGSGKSTLAQNLLVKCPQRRLVSSDAIRGYLFGDEGIQGAWGLVWGEIQQQLQVARQAQVSVIYDATNAKRCNRRELIAWARATGFDYIVGVWVNTPIWLCLARNKRRDRQVPEEVIWRMYRQLRDAPPSTDEGMDEVVNYRL